jgi:glycosyltransferase involved in cell wall biosynthesis
MSIWVHTLFKNEERYLWYSVMSVIDYVDKVLLWDTGSTDNSLEIAKEIKERFPKRVEFKTFGEVDVDEFTKVRQEMLDETKSDWVWIVDADEVWWEDSIKELVSLIEKKGNNLDSIVTPIINVVGDIYHRQEEKAGLYSIDGKKGHMSIRAMNMNIPGLHLEKPHGTQGFFDGKGVLIQDRSSKKRAHMNGAYLHFTHMIRSISKNEDKKVPKRSKKYKYELGRQFPKDYYYPEVFFREIPSFIESPWEKFSTYYYLRALVETPLRKVKRRVTSGKVGY